MRWVLIMLLYTHGPMAHDVERIEEMHLTRVGCEWARVEASLLGLDLMQAYCVERGGVVERVPSGGHVLPVAEVRP